MIETNVVLTGSTDDCTVPVALTVAVLPVSELAGVIKLDELSSTEEERTRVGSLVVTDGKTMLGLDTLIWTELESTAEVPFTGLVETLTVGVTVTELVTLTLAKPVVVTIPVLDMLGVILTTELGGTGLVPVMGSVLDSSLTVAFGKTMLLLEELNWMELVTATEVSSTRLEEMPMVEVEGVITRLVSLPLTKLVEAVPVIV